MITLSIELAKVLMLLGGVKRWPGLFGQLKAVYK